MSIRNTLLFTTMFVMFRRNSNAGGSPCTGHQRPFFRSGKGTNGSMLRDGTAQARANEHHGKIPLPCSRRRIYHDLLPPMHTHYRERANKRGPYLVPFMHTIAPQRMPVVLPSRDIGMVALEGFRPPVAFAYHGNPFDGCRGRRRRRYIGNLVLDRRLADV